jgi:hypothetical protein
MASSTVTGSRHKHCLSTKTKHFGFNQILPMHLLHNYYIYGIKLAIRNYNHQIIHKYLNYRETGFLKYIIRYITMN